MRDRARTSGCLASFHLDSAVVGAPPTAPQPSGWGRHHTGPGLTQPLKDTIDLLSAPRPITAPVWPNQASANPSDHSSCHSDKMIHNHSCRLQSIQDGQGFLHIRSRLEEGRGGAGEVRGELAEGLAGTRTGRNSSAPPPLALD